jgi:hypothetical protein
MANRLAIAAAVATISLLVLAYSGYYLYPGSSAPSTSSTSVDQLMTSPETSRAATTDANFTTPFSISSILIAVPYASMQNVDSIGNFTGVRLGLHVSSNSTGYLTISVSEANLFDVTNLVPPADAWSFSPTSLNPYAACPVAGPFGFAILQGYLDGKNYTAGKTLLQHDPSKAQTCSTQSSSSLTLPAFGNASTTEYSTNGFWAAASGGTPTAQFQRFPVGAYTVVAADEWGDVVLLHFRVPAITSDLHEVTFHQTGNCGPPEQQAGPYYTTPWSVTLGNLTKVEPVNGTVPGPSQGYSGSGVDVNLSMIVFDVPNGIYHYSVAPSDAFYGGSSGVLTVNGTDVTVQVSGPYMMSCGEQFPELIQLRLSGPMIAVTYGGTANLTAIVTGLRGTPTGSISWNDGGIGGIFSTSECTLSPSSISSESTCSVIYTTPSQSRINGSSNQSSVYSAFQAEATINATYSGDSQYASIANALSFNLDKPQLMVNTVNQNGQTIYGYEIDLFSTNQTGVGGATATRSLLAKQFSTGYFYLDTGQTYAVEAQDYDSCHFERWSDTGSTDRLRIISVTEDTELLAIYGCS